MMKLYALRVLCFMQMFCETASSADLPQEMEQLGLTLTAALLDPILLTHQATHQQVRLSPKPKYHSQNRPQTPGASGSARRALLSPLPNRRRRMRNQVYTVRSEGSLDNLATTTTSPRAILDPISQSNKPLTLVQYYVELEKLIEKRDEDALLVALSSENAKKLTGRNFMDLLILSYDRSKSGEKSSIWLYEHLFEELVDKIIPQNQPRAFYFFMRMASGPSVPRRIFSIACKHLRLLTDSQLDRLIEETEKKWIWKTLEKVNSETLTVYNGIILEMANNLDNPENIVDLAHVNLVLNHKDKGFDRKRFSVVIRRLQLIYLNLNILGGLKKVTADFTLEKMKVVTNGWINLAVNELELSIETLLSNFDEIMKHVLKSMTVDQFDSLGMFMQVFRESLLMVLDVSDFSEKMEGIEDLYVYVQQNLLHLTIARFKLFKPKSITKGQIISLLVLADESDKYHSNIITYLLSKIQINQEDLSENEMDALSLRLQIFLKGIFSFPSSRTLIPMCTSDRKLKGSEIIAWNLPEDLFISQEPSEKDENYVIMTALTNLTRLFLHRVLGIHLSDFGKVEQEANEIPEMKEMHNTANFFIERWCATQPIPAHPLIKIT